MAAPVANKSRRPYLIRAIYEWAVDNGLTPHVVVAADAAGVSVPRQFVQDGRITLNLSPMAVQSLHLDQEPMWFSARFQGRPFDVVMPSGAILAVFARENGEGIVFGEVESSEEQAKVEGKPGLHIVADAGSEPAKAGADDPDEPPPEPPRPRGRGHLRVVK